MLESSFRLTLELRDNPLGQHFAQLDAPLIEGVDIPDRPLGENGVLVKGDEFAEDFRNTRADTSASGVPSAFTSSGVLPKASASVCAKTLAISMSWCRPRGLSV